MTWFQSSVVVPVMPTNQRWRQQKAINYLAGSIRKMRSEKRKQVEDPKLLPTCINENESEMAEDDADTSSSVASTCSELSCSALQERVDHIEDTLLKLQEQNQFVLEDLDRSIKRAEEANGNMNKVLLEMSRNKVGTDVFLEFKQCIKECMQMSADRLLELRGQLASKVDMENFAEDMNEIREQIKETCARSDNEMRRVVEGLQRAQISSACAIEEKMFEKMHFLKTMNGNWRHR